MRKNANTCAFAGTIDGSCNELLSMTGSPDAEIIAQPSSGKTSIRAYSSTCDALAASTCQPGRSAGSGGCVVEKRTTSRTITSSKIATPKGLCN
ncbi:hypothetical protein D3C76_1523030 [compost metagenome]